MIEAIDAARIVDAVSKNLSEVAKAQSNFQKLPDTFWGYFARGHDSKGTFAVILTYSEKGSDVDELIRMYEKWVEKNKQKPLESGEKLTEQRLIDSAHE